jgi:hypothetical protein
VHGSEGSYINLGTDSILKPKKGTVALWVKIEVPVASGKGYLFNPIILTKNGVLDSTGKNNDFFEAYTIAYNFETHRIAAASSKSEEKQVSVHSKVAMPLNTWHHITFTYDYNYVALYVNGRLNSRLPKKFETIFSPTDSVLLGVTANEKNQRYLCGAIDDIFIYNRVLSDEEILKLYKAPDPNGFNKIIRVVKWILFVVALVCLFVCLFVYLAVKPEQTQRRQKECAERSYE